MRQGENGFLVPAGDAPALARALETLLKDRELRRRMGAQGRALVEARFRSDLVIRETLEVYDSLLHTDLAAEATAAAKA